MRSSSVMNAPPVSAAVAFHVNVPPPANHICSPSSACRMMGTALLIDAPRFAAGSWCRPGDRSSMPSGMLCFEKPIGSEVLQHQGDVADGVGQGGDVGGLRL
jgi:hypothetical protein